MSGQAQSAYRKVIVGLCHGAADAATMRTAAEFAQLLGLDLHCLFIEDEALLALAELPFAREIRLPTHTWSSTYCGCCRGGHPSGGDSDTPVAGRDHSGDRRAD